jgi:hypothetical protein
MKTFSIDFSLPQWLDNAGDNEGWKYPSLKALSIIEQECGDFISPDPWFLMGEVESDNGYGGILPYDMEKGAYALELCEAIAWMATGRLGCTADEMHYSIYECMIFEVNKKNLSLGHNYASASWLKARNQESYYQHMEILANQRKNKNPPTMGEMVNIDMASEYLLSALRAGAVTAWGLSSAGKFAFQQIPREWLFWPLKIDFLRNALVVDQHKGSGAKYFSSGSRQLYPQLRLENYLTEDDPKEWFEVKIMSDEVSKVFDIPTAKENYLFHSIVNSDNSADEKTKTILDSQKVAQPKRKRMPSKALDVAKYINGLSSVPQVNTKQLRDDICRHYGWKAVDYATVQRGIEFASKLSK